MIKIIKVGISDEAQFEAALSLLVRFFAEEEFRTAPERIRQNLALFIKNETAAVFLAYDAGAAVGVATVAIGVGVELGRNGELEDLYVLPTARGRGAARELITMAQKWCRQQDCQTLAVVITPEGETNHRLSNFYKNFGFQETGRKIMFYDFQPVPNDW